MRGSRGFFSIVLCICLLVAGHRLAGQAVFVTQAAPPAPPPPPPAGAPAGAQLKVVPPAPIGMPPEQLPRFEVASVKKPDGKTPNSTIRTPGGGRITVVNYPLRSVIMQAFGGLRDYQLSGGPSWIASDRFSITAKAETNAPRDQLMLMMRAVLVDRFQMKFHVEQKEMQAYVLTTAEKEWKPTARMKPLECPATPATAPAVPIRPDQRCGMTMLGTNGIQARGVTMTNFVSLLGSIGGLGLIHDRTGLTGTYQIELDASPSGLLRSLSMAQAMAGVNLGGGAEPNLLPTVAEGRSLDSAVRDLGLKLTRQKEMVDVLVIDSLSQPDED